MKGLEFPTFEYTFDRSDPEIAILLRQDGSFVAAFSARGATKEGILEAAKEDRRELVRAHTNPLSPETTIVAPVKEGTTNHGGWLETENLCLS